MQERVKPRTKVTLDLDTALVAAAKARGVDLQHLVESALRASLQPSSNRGLTDEDRESIEDYNRVVAEHGTFAEALRKL